MDFEKLKENYEKHKFTVKCFATGAEAVQYLKTEIKGQTVGFGGSGTLRQIGLYEALSEQNVVSWHHQIMSENVRRQATEANIYITSANGASETGELVNIDGGGNRLSASLYGPKKVYFVIGRNKITPDRESAIFRAKNVAAPKRAAQMGMKTPCAVKQDKCYDCNSPQRICCGTVILDRAMALTPMEVLFIDEDLGL